MLGHLPRITQGFERDHGIDPNVVYIRRTPFEVLVQGVPGLVQAVAGYHAGVPDDRCAGRRLAHPEASLPETSGLYLGKAAVRSVSISPAVA